MEEETGRDPSCKPKSSSFPTPNLLPPNINHPNAHNRRLPPGSLFGLGLGPRGPGLFPDWWYYYYYYYYHHHHQHRHLNPYPPSILPLPAPPPPPRHLLHPPPPPLLHRSQPTLSPLPVAPSSDGRSVRDVDAPPPPSGKVGYNKVPFS